MPRQLIPAMHATAGTGILPLFERTRLGLCVQRLGLIDLIRNPPFDL
jgi:hypothetical protein